MYGFLLKPGHGVKTWHEQTQLLHSLRDKGWHIIYLRRVNILRQTISMAIAKQRKKWHDTSANSPEKLNIHLDTGAVVTELIKLEKSSLLFDKLFQQLAAVSIVYETDLLATSAHQGTLERLFSWLQLFTVPVQTELVKTTSEQLSDVVQNYGELAVRLNGTRYGQFL